MSVIVRRLVNLKGLSTDTKPTSDDISTGSTFTEIDTGLVFVYNAQNKSWLYDQEQTETSTNTCNGIGILSVDKTASTGKVDTYTITYTNGATTTFDVTNGITIEVNKGLAEPLIPNKLYTVTIGDEGREISYKTNRYLYIENTSYKDGVITSSVIDGTKYFPKDIEDTFIVRVNNLSADIVFRKNGDLDDDHASYIGTLVDKEGTDLTYIGHFEFVNSKKTSNTDDYYFIAKPYSASVKTLESDLSNLEEKLSVTDEDWSDILNALDSE